MDANIESKINALEVSESWKDKFRVLAEVGKPITYAMRLRNESAYKKLPIGIKFNIWAFLFGLIYYFLKGMWKKGIVLFGSGIAIGIVLIVMFGESAGNITTMIVTSLLFATFANFDYYRTMVLEEDFWF
ncbi:MAG: hypothetical protein QG565_655 [Campylobacterota bacterium]|nr:hypothetical protein [Campylobacterota bacterium]